MELVGQLFVSLSQSQEESIGDGTTSILIYAGQLCHESLGLLEKGLSAHLISNGFQIALEHAISISKELSQPLKRTFSNLKQMAMTPLTSKMVWKWKEHLAQLCVDAVILVADFSRGDCNLDRIKLEFKEGGSILDTKLVHGITIRRGKSHENMPSVGTGIMHSKFN